MAENAIVVSELVKTYKGDIQAVKGVSFCVRKGEVFAFLGPNGAGKSTTINILNTLIKPTSGQVRIAGYDIIQQSEMIRRKIGAALQVSAIDPELTGKELVVLHGRLYGLSKKEASKRATELLELVNLVKDADRPGGTYSGGMQRRLDLALTLVNRPEILFLDEPTVGLDPVGRVELWQEIRRLNQEYKTTIFLTTQYLDEADKVADNISIINDGMIVVSGSPRELKHSVAPDRISLSFATVEEREKAKVIIPPNFTSLDENQTDLNVYIENSREYLPIIIRKMSESQVFPKDISISSPTLDDVFFHATRNQRKSVIVINEVGV
jgi:ABC-2 type transport system ATP-binding protein